MAIIEAIATTYLEADAASVEFSGIPATYEHLQLRASQRSARVAATDFGRIQLGTGGGAVDTGTNYFSHNMRGLGSATGAGGDADIFYIPRFTGATANAGEYAAMIVDILDYANTNKNTTFRGLDGMVDNMYLFSGLWDATGAVDRIKIFAENGNLVRGSEFTLYGLKSS